MTSSRIYSTSACTVRLLLRLNYSDALLLFINHGIINFDYFGDEAQLGQLVAKIKDALKRSGQLV